MEKKDVKKGKKARRPSWHLFLRQNRRKKAIGRGKKGEKKKSLRFENSRTVHEGRSL